MMRVLLSLLACRVGGELAAAGEKLELLDDAFTAIEQYNNEGLTALLNDDEVPADSAKSDGTTLLHIAAFVNNSWALEMLLVSGARTDRWADHGGTPLHVACQGGKKEAVAVLLKHGADINALTRCATITDACDKGITPL